MPQRITPPVLKTPAENCRKRSQRTYVLHMAETIKPSAAKPHFSAGQAIPGVCLRQSLRLPGHPRFQPKFPLQGRPQRKQEIAGRRRLDQIAHLLRPNAYREISQGLQHVPRQHVQSGKDRQRGLDIPGACFAITFRQVRPGPDQMALQSAFRNSRPPLQKRTVEKRDGSPCPASGQFVLCPPVQRRFRRVSKRRHGISPLTRT